MFAGRSGEDGSRRIPRPVPGTRSDHDQAAAQRRKAALGPRRTRRRSFQIRALLNPASPSRAGRTDAGVMAQSFIRSTRKGPACVWRRQVRPAAAAGVASGPQQHVRSPRRLRPAVVSQTRALRAGARFLEYFRGPRAVLREFPPPAGFPGPRGGETMHVLPCR